MIRRQYKAEDGKPFDQKAIRAKHHRAIRQHLGLRSKVSATTSARIKCDAYLTSGVTVSEEEVLKEFQTKNSKFDLTYVTVNATDLAKTITPTDEELKDYFEQNKQLLHRCPAEKDQICLCQHRKIGEKLRSREPTFEPNTTSLPGGQKIAGVLGQEIVLRVRKA